MEEQKIMTVAETIEELDFAMRHGFDFTKHRYNELLNREEVSYVCQKLKVNAKLEANVLAKEGTKYFNAYYTLQFEKPTNSGTNIVAVYFSDDIISSEENYTVDYAEDEDYTEEEF